MVKAGFGAARLGDIRNHAFFIVRVINTGERAVTVPEVEWVSDRYTFTLNVFRHSEGRDLPVKVEPDDEVQILFDVGAAARAVMGHKSEDSPTRIRVYGSGRRRAWEVAITEEMRLEAEEEIEREKGDRNGEGSTLR